MKKIIPENITAFIEGGHIPNGKVKISGAKNSATRLLAASLISDRIVKLLNFPCKLIDVLYKIDFIEKNNGSVYLNEIQDSAEIDPTSLTCKSLSDYNFPIRTTYLLVPGLIKKSGIARIPYPGGCKIGSRGYDVHIMIWQKFGAVVVEKDNHIEVVAGKGFKATEIDLPILTIGGTENAIISGCIAKGTTIIRNAYISPEVLDLIRFLKSMNIPINVKGNNIIEIQGCMTIDGSIFPVMPDRIEALTWMIYGSISNGSILIEDVPIDSMSVPLIHLKEVGIDYFRNSNNIIIKPECIHNGEIQPFEIACGTYPGIISDMQPLFTLLALHAIGRSKIFDYRYPERIQYCSELSKIYGNDSLKWKHGEISITGGCKPTGNIVTSTDLRGSIVMILAGLIASGNSQVNFADMAFRGYNDLENKLKLLGINIEFKQILNG